MLNLSFINLYVADAAASTAFYTDLLGNKPLQTSPDFVMFGMESGVMLGLWRRDGVQPEAKAPSGAAGEICFSVPDTDAVYADWLARRLPIAQPPTSMGFGRTFVALDPDGHRLRVFTPAVR